MEREVAICLAGLSRTLCTAFPNIYQHMVAPIRNASDVYVFTQSSACSAELVNLFVPVKYRVRTPSSERGVTKYNYWFPCWQDIVAHETAAHASYEWVMKLRTDVVYRAPLQPMPWKSFSYPVVFAEACGSGSFPKETTPVGHGCPERIGARWGCAKDTWNLMNRMAATTYFTTRHDKNCYSGIPECRLGCSLFAHKISVVKTRIQRKILRGI